MSTFHYRERTERLEVHRREARRAYIEHGSPPAREPVPDPELLPEWMTVPGASCPWPRQPGAWSCALLAVDPSPATALRLALKGGQRATLAAATAQPGERVATSVPSSRPPTAPPPERSTAREVLAEDDALRRVADEPLVRRPSSLARRADGTLARRPGDPVGVRGTRAAWGRRSDPAPVADRAARAAEVERWEAEVARVGRVKAGPPPWGAAEEDAPCAATPDPPPAEAESERVRAGGPELRALRDAAGLTQGDVAQRIAPGADMTAASARVALARFEAGSGGLSRAALDAAVQACRAAGSRSVRCPA